MACFLVSAAVGLVTTAFRKKFPEDWHIDWLNALIWGGVAGLAVEHVAHQEIVPWPPFLTAMADPADTATMLGEMAAVGIPMAVVLIAAWAALVLVYEKFLARGPLKAGSRAGI